MKVLNSKERKRLKDAIELQKLNFDEEALAILQKLEKDNPDNSKVLAFLGLILAKTEQRKEAIPYLKKAIKTNPNNELLSLTLYISYFEVNKHEKAFKVLFRFLDKYPADLFKDALEELLDGLQQGYGDSHKDNILKYALKNNIEIPDDLLKGHGLI